MAGFGGLGDTSFSGQYGKALPRKGASFFTFLACERVAELNFLVVLKVCKNEAKRL